MNDNEEHTANAVIRASDAERDRIEVQLKQHYTVGRLTLSELEERVAAAYEARTREQLDALMKDLPGEAESPVSHTQVIDSRLLIILLCIAPPRRSSTGSCPNAQHIEGVHGHRTWLRYLIRKTRLRTSPCSGRHSELSGGGEVRRAW